MTLPDYSSWLTPQRLVEEERHWGDPSRATWPIFIDWIKRVVTEKSNIASMIEFGCGTGWVPKHLSPEIHYVGVDANPDCLLYAMRKNPTRWFSLNDIREPQVLTFDLSCAFSVLKHFGLGEWDAVVGNVVRAGRISLFSMPLADVDKDDGTEFPHTWVTAAHLQTAVMNAGHMLLGLEPIATGEYMALSCRC